MIVALLYLALLASDAKPTPALYVPRTRLCTVWVTVSDRCFTHDGKGMAITHFASPKFSVWDVPTGKEVLASNEKSAVTALAFSADGKLLASTSRDRTILGTSPRSW